MFVKGFKQAVWCVIKVMLSGGACRWPFLVGGIICLVNSVNTERRPWPAKQSDDSRIVIIVNLSQDGNNTSVMHIVVLVGSHAHYTDYGNQSLYSLRRSFCLLNSLFFKFLVKRRFFRKSRNFCQKRPKLSNQAFLQN